MVDFLKTLSLIKNLDLFVPFLNQFKLWVIDREYRETFDQISYAEEDNKLQRLKIEKKELKIKEAELNATLQETQKSTKVIPQPQNISNVEKQEVYATLQEMRQSINGAITIPQLQNTINVVSILYEKLGAEKIEQLLSEPREDDSRDALIKILKQSGERTSPILQNIWANMLKAEMEHPGTITRKLVNTVEELPENTIILFKRICKNIMFNSGSGFIMINIDKNNNNLQVYKNDNVITEVEHERVHKDDDVITEIEYKELFQYGIFSTPVKVALPRNYTLFNEHYEIVIPNASYGFMIYYELSILGRNLFNYVNMEPDDFNSDIVDIYNMISSYARKPEEVVIPFDYGLNIPLIFKKTDNSSILYPEEYKGKTLGEFWGIKAKENNFKSINDMLAQVNKDKEKTV